LLSILLFNNIGFSVICNIIQNKSDLHFEAKLDANQYNEAHLIEIKIPLKLPYTTEWKNFERYDGEIKVNGLYYKYVKRKVIIDSLVLLCLPNPTKLRLESARDDAFELVNGLKNTSGKKAASSILKNLLSEYLAIENRWSLPPIESILHRIHFDNTQYLSYYTLFKSVKPPSISLI
jgi:hypothetical protein